MNIEEFKHILALMKVKDKYYEAVKAEMLARGRWKRLPRGVPFKKSGDIRRNKLK